MTIKTSNLIKERVYPKGLKQGADNGNDPKNVLREDVEFYA